MTTNWSLSVLASLLNRQLSYTHEILIIGFPINYTSLGLHVKDGRIEIFPFQNFRSEGRFNIKKKEQLGYCQIGDGDDALRKLAQDIAREAQTLGPINNVTELFSAVRVILDNNINQPGRKTTKLHRFTVTSRRRQPFSDPTYLEMISLGILWFAEQVPRYFDRELYCISLGSID
jgi:hypothetical protein